MKQIIAWAESLTLAIGGPGLFLVAFLDSSFLSLPEINDILIIWMVTKYKERMIFYALMATLGSVAGCFTLYVIGRKGGEAFLRRRVHERHIERGMRLFQRYGLLAILGPAILPPPAPFKIFVLLAGVAQVPIATFAVAVGVGRGLRYFAEGLLAIWYGDLASEYIRANGKPIAILFAALVLVGGVAYFAWQSRRRGSSGAR